MPPRRLRRLRSRPPTLVAVAVLVIFGFGSLGLGAQQRLPVGHGDLVVVGMDFAERQETVTVAAIFDEGGLQRRFDARHPRQVDVSFELLLVLGFEIEFFDTVTADDDDACFLRVGGVYQHFVGHYSLSSRLPQAGPGTHPCVA